MIKKPLFDVDSYVKLLKPGSDIFFTNYVYIQFINT